MINDKFLLYLINIVYKKEILNNIQFKNDVIN